MTVSKYLSFAAATAMVATSLGMAAPDPHDLVAHRQDQIDGTPVVARRKAQHAVNQCTAHIAGDLSVVA